MQAEKKLQLFFLLALQTGGERERERERERTQGFVHLPLRSVPFRLRWFRPHASRTFISCSLRPETAVVDLIYLDGQGIVSKQRAKSSKLGLELTYKILPPDGIRFQDTSWFFEFNSGLHVCCAC